jgi:S-formylglutathione hydrolase FrmB
MAIMRKRIRRELAARRRLTAVVITVAVAGVPLAGCSSPVHMQGAQVVHMTIDSRFVPGAMPLTLVTPAGGGAHRPLLVFLHGVIYDNNSQLTDQMFAALAALGARAPDIAFPYGAQSYWHNRASGAWGSYVLDEVIPTALRVLDADPRRVAIGGISMGGFGAYDLARLDPGRFCAVGGDSAAIWPAYDDIGLQGPGAFDNAGDFARHDVIGAAEADPQLYGHAKLWLDVGAQDDFYYADQQLANVLHIRLHVWPGGHDFGYWNAHWSDYLGFYAHAFAACG